MANYTLYGMELIKDDSCMETFAKSLLEGLQEDYEIYKECNSAEEIEAFENKILNAVQESIGDLQRTDIDYLDLMKRFAKDIGELLYDMDNHGYDLSSIHLSFFENAKESFESLLYQYIQINFDKLIKEVAKAKSLETIGDMDSKEFDF